MRSRSRWLPRQLRSWWKQEAQALAPRQRQRLLRLSAVLLIGLMGLNLQRHHKDQQQQRDTQLQQAQELAAAQWNTIRATAYDWAHWDETHAYARGEAPGYPARNLQVANGLTSVAPVVLILNQSNQLLTLQGRKGASTWARDPLVRCTRSHATRVLKAPGTYGLSCSDPAGQRLWIGVIEPITDTTEQDELSGLMVLLAPLRHPSHGAQLQALMASLEQQLHLAPPGPQAMTLQGRSLWGDSQRVLTLRPQPVVEPTLRSMGRDLALASPFVLLFLALRGGLMLQRRSQVLLQRRSQQRSERRLRRARRQLDQLFDQLSLQQREQALRALPSLGGDPIDDLARRLEAYAAVVRLQQGHAPDHQPLRYAPMCDQHGRLQRLLVQSFPLSEGSVQAALAGWANLPAASRAQLGLQFELTRTQWCDPAFLAGLASSLNHTGCPEQLCTLAARVEQLVPAVAQLAETMATLRSRGFQLALIHSGSASDPGFLLNTLPFHELQLSVPSLIEPGLQEPQQALFTALVHLAEARGLRISVCDVATNQQRERLQALPIQLVAGPLIAACSEDPAELLLSC